MELTLLHFMFLKHHRSRESRLFQLDFVHLAKWIYNIFINKRQKRQKR